MLDYSDEINESYLTDETEDLSKYIKRSEMRDFKMLGRLEKYLIKRRIRFSVEGECFVVSKPFGEGVSKMYIWVDGGYCFGPYECIYETNHIKEIISFTEKWLQK